MAMEYLMENDDFPLDDSLNTDTDGDGLDDAVDTDDDNDGISDTEENSAGTDPLSQDTDSDGLSDGEENSLGTDPLNLILMVMECQMELINSLMQVEQMMLTGMVSLMRKKPSLIQILTILTLTETACLI